MCVVVHSISKEKVVNVRARSSFFLVFANQFKKMHVYNRLIISSDGFAIILKTSIINFSSCAALLFLILYERASGIFCRHFIIRLVFLLLFLGFETKKGSKCTHAHIHIHTFYCKVIRVIHAHSIDRKKRIYTRWNAI